MGKCLIVLQARVIFEKLDDENLSLIKYFENATSWVSNNKNLRSPCLHFCLAVGGSLTHNNLMNGKSFYLNWSTNNQT